MSLLPPPLPTTAKSRDVQVAQIGADTLVLRSRTWDQLKFEVEYARQRGTTANSYLIQARECALFDPPGESFTEIFLEDLHQHQYFQRLNYIILSHINSNRLVTLKALLELVSPHTTIVCSKPAAITLRSAMPTWEAQIRSVRDGDVLDLGNGHELKFAFVPTPRWHDALCTYDPATQILFTDKLFGAHVCGEPVFDEHWRRLDEDRRYYFDCLHANQATQVETILAELASLPAKIYAPAHGPIVRHSLSRLTLDYRLWCEQQQTQTVNVALLYTSAYGNTATIAQAIAQGITDADGTVEMIDCEFTQSEEIERVVERCDGFIIGSPTLGGHAPTQIQTALGIVLSTAAKTKVAGVFGSYGWSGEAVDQLESKLQDAGYRFGFTPIRVKFKPTDETLQQCQAAGAEFVYTARKVKKIYAPRQMVAESQSDRASQAVARVTGSLCVMTAKSGNTRIGMLTSWVSQAGFSPPALTVAIAKHGTAESISHPGEHFVLNVLREGMNLRRHFLRSHLTGEDVFTEIATAEAANGCPILTEALAYLECTVHNRMESGDHWLLYATVENGKVLDSTGITAVNHRKSATPYQAVSKQVP